jgi:hypothetical protein
VQQDKSKQPPRIFQRKKISSSLFACVVFLKLACLYLLSIEREEFWKAANSFVRLFAPPPLGKMWVHVELFLRKRAFRGRKNTNGELLWRLLGRQQCIARFSMLRLWGFPRVHCFCFSSPPRFTLSVQNSGGKEGRPLATERGVYPHLLASRAPSSYCFLSYYIQG